MDKTKKTIFIASVLSSLSGGTYALVNNDYLTVDDWQAQIEIIDYEAKKMGGITIRDAKNKDDFYKKLKKKVKNIPASENNFINGERYSREDYANLKNNLLK